MKNNGIPTNNFHHERPIQWNYFGVFSHFSNKEEKNRSLSDSLFSTGNLILGILFFYIIKLAWVVGYFSSVKFDFVALTGYTDLLIFVLVFFLVLKDLRRAEKVESTAQPASHFEVESLINVTTTINNPIEIESIQPLEKLVQKHDLVDRLDRVMNTEKPYTSPTLTVGVLAERLGISTRYLSQVLRDELGKNFYCFVNDYRIEEVKARLVNPDYKHLSILGIAFDCGFNSKSAFHDVFKKSTGLTPKGYVFRYMKEQIA